MAVFVIVMDLFATLECEPLDRERFENQAEAKMPVFDFIEGTGRSRDCHAPGEIPLRRAATGQTVVQDYDGMI